MALFFDEPLVLVALHRDLLLHLDLHPLPALHVLVNAGVFLVQFDLRAVLRDHLVRLGDGAIYAAEELIADGRIDPAVISTFFRASCKIASAPFGSVARITRASIRDGPVRYDLV